MIANTPDREVPAKLWQDEAYRTCQRTSRSVDQETVNGVFVVLVVLPAIGMLRRVLERVLYTINLVAQSIGLIFAFPRVRRNHVEILIVELEQPAVLGLRVSEDRCQLGGF